MDKICGIYMIKNSINNKMYIGQAVNIYKRWEYGHASCLNKNNHKNKHLQNAWNKYGKDNFEFKILEECVREELNDKEKYWISYYDSFENGYNLTKGGEGILGLKFSSETKQKIRNAHLGKKLSDETKQKLSEYFKKYPSNSLLGKHHTEKTREKIRIKAIGRKHSEETKAKFSIKFSGEGNGMYGKKHKEESKEKMKYLKNGKLKSESYKGENNPFFNKKHSKETRKKISESNKGKRTRTKLNVEQVKEIKNILNNKNKNIMWKELYIELAIKYNVSSKCIHNIKTGARWKDIGI